MSRTWKDKPWKFSEHNDFGKDRIRVTYEAEITKTLCTTTWQIIELEKPVYVTRFCSIQQKSTKPKVRKSKNTEWKWYRQTPSWWTHLYMIRPMRRRGRTWEHKVLFEDIEDSDPPSVGNKPHKYYW